MKKTVVFLLVFTMCISCMACGRNENDTPNPSMSETESETNTQTGPNAGNTEIESETDIKVQITDANEILQKTWAQYEEDKKFAAVGGHYSGYTDNAPAKYDISHVADIEAVFCIPAEVVTMLDDAASLQHGMNVNNFSAMACHIKDDANMQAIIDAIKERTVNNQWICGHPDRLIIVTIGDEYLVTAFGDGEIVDNFQRELFGVYETAKVAVDEDL